MFWKEEGNHFYDYLLLYMLLFFLWPVIGFIYYVIDYFYHSNIVGVFFVSLILADWVASGIVILKARKEYYKMDKKKK